MYVCNVALAERSARARRNRRAVNMETDSRPNNSQVLFNAVLVICFLNNQLGFAAAFIFSARVSERTAAAD